jgi:hypothetical protein
VGFGALAIVVVWLPLAALALALAGPRLERVAVASIGAVVAAAFAGGFLVGKWGGPRAGVREAALAGAAAGLGGVVLSWVSFGIALGSAAVVVIATPAAAIGGTLGVRRR